MSSPQNAEQTMLNNLQEKFGKSLEEWITLLKSKNILSHAEILKYLKNEHGFTHGYANLVSVKLRKTDAGSSDESNLIAEQYSAGKENLKPLYDKIIKELEKSCDFEIAVKKAYVSLRRKKQFAIIQPSTKTRLDLGVNLKGMEPEGRLELSGSFNAMVSHRVRLSSIDEINKELIDWLIEAYNRA